MHDIVRMGHAFEISDTKLINFHENNGSKCHTGRAAKMKKWSFPISIKNIENHFEIQKLDHVIFQ